MILIIRGTQLMYDKIFSKIYDEYGWDYFSLTMGKSILDYFKVNNIIIKNNLDLCCGTGVLCDYFYKNNIKTKGIDISKYMLQIAKSKNNNIEFKNENVLFYKDNKKYDLVTMTCDAINHLIGDGDLECLLKNVNKLLNKNGYFIFDVINKDKIEFNKKIVSNRDNGIKVYYYITVKDNLINTNITVKENDNFIYKTDIIERIYDLNYINNKLEKNGFILMQAKDKILNEEQRFKDKLYFICKKM